MKEQLQEIYKTMYNDVAEDVGARNDSDVKRMA